MSTPEIIAENFVFPECPRWREDGLWFSDMHGGEVVHLSPDGAVLERFGVPGGPSGLGWLPDGQMLIVSIGKLCVFRRDAQRELNLHADLSPWHRFHSNDMVVDSKGNAYVGEVGFRMGKEEERHTAVVLVRADGSAEVGAQPLFTPNGAVISGDGKTYVVAESAARRLTAFTVLPDGTLTDPRLFTQFEVDIPDGICIDAEGCIWIASPFARSVVRVSEKDGIVDRITMPEGLQVYACMLGGSDRRDLYICCAPDHNPAKARELRRGAVARVRVAISGTGCP